MATNFCSSAWVSRLSLGAVGRDKVGLSSASTL